MGDFEQERILKPGDVLGDDYEIEEFIGEGGTSEIYRAYNLTSQEIVAIKVLKTVHSKNEVLLRKELIRRVNHESIVKIYDMRRDKALGVTYLLMEYIDGPSLETLMLKDSVEPQLLIQIGRVLCDGLHAAHQAGVFHRDISPDNILLRGGHAEGATLIDFGVNKDQAPGAGTILPGGGFVGKTEFASPEQYIEGKVDARSEIYALGATLLAAARGKSPKFPRKDEAIKELKRQPVDLSDISPPLRDILAKLLDPDPSKRPRNAKDAALVFDEQDEIADPTLLSDIADLADAGRQSHMREAHEPPRRRRGWFGFAAVGTALAICAALFFFTPLRDLVLPRLPLEDPYRFTASSETRALSGHAPDEEALTAMTAAAKNAIGADPQGVLSLARGAPSPEWDEGMVEILNALAPLTLWSITVIGLDVVVSGETDDSELVQRVRTTLREIEAARGLVLDRDIKKTIKPLDGAVLSQLVTRYADCGPLEVTPNSGLVEVDDKISVMGDISSLDRVDEIESILEDIIEDRRLNFDLQEKAAAVCLIQDLLPSKEFGNIRIIFRNGQLGAPEYMAPFRPKDVPIIQVDVPEEMDGFLHVFWVDFEERILHFLPRVTQPENRLIGAGNLSGGRRLVTLTYPLELGTAKIFAFDLVPPFGDTMIFALVTDRPLIGPDLREEEEELAEFAPDLASEIERLYKEGGLIAFVGRPFFVEE